jgi:hypothetical protein
VKCTAPGGKPSGFFISFFLKENLNLSIQPSDMKTRFVLSLVGLAFLLSTCDQDKDEAFPDLKKYLIRFQEEAVKRGYDVDLSSVQAVYVDAINVQSQTYCGYGYSNYQGTGVKRIEISKSCGWATLSDLERENLFFHEIGHAFFQRPHDQAKRCDGTPVSLMCTTSPNQYKIYAKGESDIRDYYINELLDKLTAIGQCISYDQNFSNNPVFFSNSAADQDWIFYSSKGVYTGKHSDVLTISAAAGATENGYWFRQFISPNIPECAEVKVRMTLSSSNLTGKGVGIAMRVYDNVVQKDGALLEQFLFYTTEDKPISGQLNDVVQELAIPCFSRKTTYIIIFGAMLAGTTGDVTFKDIQVLVTPK